jgi:hypothetical protein
MMGAEPVLLVRYSTIDKDEVIKLKNLLIDRYPNSNFTIVAVAADQYSGEDWNIEKIKYFCARYGDVSFYPQWQNIFNFFNIARTKNLFDEHEDDTFVCDGSCKCID